MYICVARVSGLYIYYYAGFCEQKVTKVTVISMSLFVTFEMFLFLHLLIIYDNFQE